MNITVYLGATQGDLPAFAELAREVGEWVARAGHGLVYGGSDVGCMGRLATAARDGGARVTGVEPRFLVQAVRQLDGIELIETETMGERMAKMIELGDAYLALPGGPGTLEEITELISMVKMGFNPGPVALLDWEGYYAPLRAQLASMAGHGFFPPERLAKIAFVRRVADLDGWLAGYRPGPDFEGLPLEQTDLSA